MVGTFDKSFMCAGNLVNVVIPRPNPERDATPGVGKVRFSAQRSSFLLFSCTQHIPLNDILLYLISMQVFLEYADLDGAAKARSGMNGRKFGGNQVVALYYPENKYAQGDYEGC